MKYFLSRHTLVVIQEALAFSILQPTSQPLFAFIIILKQSKCVKKTSQRAFLASLLALVLFHFEKTEKSAV